MAVQHTQIAVIGGGITGLALGFHLRRAGVDVHVLEASSRPGGNIHSESRDGYLIEWGPNGFLDNEPASLRLVEALGLQPALVRAHTLAEKRWITRKGKLRALPTNPIQFLTGDVLSLPGKLRVLLEGLQPRGNPDVDESVFDFARRRIGREAAEVLVDAMVTGVHAGDSRRLSLQSAFPRMREMEQTYGGLFRAMRAIARERRAARRRARAEATAAGSGKSGGKSGGNGGGAAGERAGGEHNRGGHGRSGSGGSAFGPGGKLTSFLHGMETLPATLAREIGEHLHVDTPLAAIRPEKPKRWVLDTGAGDTWHAEQVVLATPAWVTAPLVHALDADLALELAAIPSAPVAVAALGFAENDVRQVERGFGFLIPGREQSPVLGVLYDTWVYPNRSPVGKVLFRAMLGGFREPTAVQADDAALVQHTLDTLHRLTGLRATPELQLVIRHPRGIPQYVTGHAARLARIEQRCAHHPGLTLAGSSYHGVAMNACMKEAEALAERLREACGAPASED